MEFIELDEVVPESPDVSSADCAEDAVPAFSVPSYLGSRRTEFARRLTQELMRRQREIG
jgi:hypothetical protein